MDQQEKEGVDRKDCEEVPGEVGGSPGWWRGGEAGVDQPRALALCDQAQEEGGRGGEGGRKKKSGHR